MIYLLSAILVGFGAWYAYHVWQKMVYKRKMRDAVKDRPVPKSFVFFGSGSEAFVAPEQDERIWEIRCEERHQQDILNGTYTPPSAEQLRTLDKAIESVKKNPPIYRESFAKYADDEDSKRNNSSDVVAMAMIADAFIPTPDATDSFSGGGGDFGGGGANGSWDSGSSSSSYDSGSSFSSDSGGGSDSGSFGGSD